MKNPSEVDLNGLFERVEADFIFYGHQHRASDMLGKSRYINLGSGGCFNKAEVRIGILDDAGGGLNLKKISIPYDDEGLMEKFEKREVPARDFIKKVFMIRE